jgi:hypothetical protein
VENQREYGRLELKTFQFQGSLTLQWTEKGGHKSKFTPCRIVPRKSFDLLLRSNLLAPITPKKPAFDHEISALSLPPSLEDPTISAQDDSSLSSTGSFDGVLQPSTVIDDSSEK